MHVPTPDAVSLSYVILARNGTAGSLGSVNTIHGSSNRIHALLLDLKYAYYL